MTGSPEKFEDRLRRVLDQESRQIQGRPVRWQELRQVRSNRGPTGSRPRLRRGRRGAHHRRTFSLIRPGAWSNVALVGSALVVIAVIFVAFGLRADRHTSRGTTATAGHSLSQSQRQRVDRYVSAAVMPALHDATSCFSNRIDAAVSKGSPSHTLLAILGVLRRPASPSDGLPAPPVPGGLAHMLGGLGHVYIRYIRRARVVSGTSYYVIPSANTGHITVRCARQIRVRLDHELPHVPPALRAPVLMQGVRQIQRLGPHQGVFIFEHAKGSGGAAGGADAADIKQVGEFGSDGTREGAIVTGLVPDGVATVELYYPAIRSTSGGQRPFTITAPVINNLVVVKVPLGAEAASAPIRIWRAANRSIIKRITTH